MTFEKGDSPNSTLVGLNEKVVLPWNEGAFYADCGLSLERHWVRVMLGEFPEIRRRSLGGGRRGGLTVQDDLSKHLLQILVNLDDEYCGAVLDSKQRDDSRGKRVVPLYGETHASASVDPVCVGVKREGQVIRDRIENVKKNFGAGRRSKL